MFAVQRAYISVGNKTQILNKKDRWLGTSSSVDGAAFG